MAKKAIIQKTTLDMLNERSAGAIIYRKENSDFLFLLLHYEEGHWGAAKGHIEEGEKTEETAMREISEETGLTDINLITDFKRENQYFYHKGNKLSNKTVIFFLAEAFSDKVTLSSEHVDFAWLPFSEALSKVTFKSEKAVWEDACSFLKIPN